MGKSYEDIGFDEKMIKTASFAGTRDYTSALEENLKQEPTAYLHRTAISKGTFQTILGGLVEFYDTTGGTKVLTYNPSTGVVTILGSLVANQVNTGTYTNIILAGTPNLVGTLTNGVLANNTIGTPLLTGGTVNNVTMGTPAVTGGTLTSSVLNTNTIGTPSVTGGTVNSVYQSNSIAGVGGSVVYVKTVNFAGSAITTGTVVVNGGIITSIT